MGYTFRVSGEGRNRVARLDVSVERRKAFVAEEISRKVHRKMRKERDRIAAARRATPVKPPKNGKGADA